MDDLTELPTLSEQTILDTLQDRFAQDRIYTCIGDILIAVNPFKPLPIYDDEHANKYTNSTAAALPPHVFRTADRVYNAMCQSHKSQVCVISGESGAGKTETSKLFMRHLAHLCKHHSIRDTDEPLHDRILKTNVILETFGNAETKMNNNSSRFGKYVDLIFGRGGELKGATIRHYLLEKSRITLQTPDERGYHIFYHVLAGQDPWFEQLPVLPPQEYPYLRWPDTEWSPIVPWPDVMDALETVGFARDEIPAIMRLVLAVLELGRIDFDESSPDVSQVADTQVVEKVAGLLGVNAAAMSQHMVETQYFVHGERYTKPNTVYKSHQGVEALAKCAYDALFEWLVTRMDTMLHSSAALDGDELHIGILDIFGFENFKTNGFEQMCINVANERLQFFFNLNVFQMELNDYEKEEVEVEGMTFTNNFDTLELFYHKSMNVFSLLDEESRFQNSTDVTLVRKLSAALKEQPAYSPCNAADQFRIKHFAGHVTYTAAEFLDKNRDALPVELTRLLKGSSDPFVAEVFAAVVLRGAGSSPSSSSSSSSRRMAGRSAVRRFSTDVLDRMRNRSSHHHHHHDRRWKQRDAGWTVSGQFRASLDELIERMSVCAPTFVRCIKPNTANRPVEFDVMFVKKQLEYTGVFETTRIRKDGFAHRLLFRDFLDRYYTPILGRSSARVIATGVRCEEVLTTAQRMLGDTPIAGRKPALDGWRIGRTKVFLKWWHVDALSFMVSRVETAALNLQAIVRGFLGRRTKDRLQRQREHYQMLGTGLLQEISSKSGRLFNTQQSLIDEDESWPGGLDRPTPRPDGRQFMRNHFKNLSKARKEVEKWWLKYERVGGFHCDEDGRIFPWFHGLLDRSQAEELLDGTQPGTFLVRVNERTTGYVLSFTTQRRFRHYKIHKSEEGGYQIFGFEEDFGSLAELVDHYQQHGFGRTSDGRAHEDTHADADAAGGAASNNDDNASTENNSDNNNDDANAAATDTDAPTAVNDADANASTSEEDTSSASAPSAPEADVVAPPPPPPPRTSANSSAAQPDPHTPEDAVEAGSEGEQQQRDGDGGGDGGGGGGGVERKRGEEEFIDTVLECTHALRLGDIDEVAVDGVDPAVKRLPKQKKKPAPAPVDERAKEEEEFERLREERAGRTVFTFTAAEDSPENEEERLDASEYLDTRQPMPQWLYGPISREVAEDLLSRQGMFDGMFLLREKTVTTDKVQIALSYSFEGNFSHHILEKNKGQPWLLDKKSLGYDGSLNHVVDTFMRQKDPGLNCKLSAPAISNEFKVATITPPALFPMATPTPPPARSANRSGRRRGRGRRGSRGSGALPALPTAPVGRIEVNGQAIPPERWGPDQVVQWLSMLNLQRYAGVFRQHSITGRHIAILNAKQLSILVPSMDDQLLLKNAITILFSENRGSVEDRVAASVQAGGQRRTFANQRSVRPHRQPHEFFSRRHLFFSPPEDKLKKYAKKGDMRAIENLLIRHENLRVDRIRRDGDHKTPLFVAAERGHVDVVRILLRHGANPHLRSYAGISPLEIAQINRHAFVVSVLQSHIQSTLRSRAVGTAPTAPLRLSRLPPQAAETVRSMMGVEQQQQHSPASSTSSSSSSPQHHHHHHHHQQPSEHTYMAPVPLASSSTSPSFGDSHAPPPPARRRPENKPAPPRRPTSTFLESSTPDENIYDERTTSVSQAA